MMFNGVDYAYIKTLYLNKKSKICLYENTKTNHKVVYKFYTPIVERSVYENELGILKKINDQHLNIIKMYGKSSLKMCIILEYCTYSLYDLYFKSLSIDKLLNYLKQIASALIFLHQQFIIHGDLKPENIMIDNNDTVKLIDFGGATCTKDSIGNTISPDKYVFNGTVMYLAPEYFDEIVSYENRYKKPKINPFVTTKVDTWAYGVITFELFNNQNEPFSGYLDKEFQKPYVNYYNIQNAEYTLIPDVNPEFKVLIENLLVKNVNERYSSEQILNYLDYINL